MNFLKPYCKWPLSFVLVLTVKLHASCERRQSCRYPLSSFSTANTFKVKEAENFNKGCSTKNSVTKNSAMSVADYADCNIICLKDLGEDATQKTDVIVAGRRLDAKQHIIFFGGDLQDYPENMLSHRDNGRYVRWNSLATAALMHKRFPDALILVIKPHHMHLKTFSVYSQFVESNDFGSPVHSSDHGAWRTLYLIYKMALSLALASSDKAPSSGSAAISGTILTVGVEDKSSKQIPHDVSSQELGNNVARLSQCTLDSNPQIDYENKTTTNFEMPLHLIGFSKGCVVLNQLLYELDIADKDPLLRDFVKKVKAMTWLDGGHSGGSNTWVTDPAIIKRLASLPIAVHVHVTPYQVQDEMRKWIGKEKRRFVELLHKAGSKASDTLHFDDEPKSIENHFRVLEVF